MTVKKEEFLALKQGPLSVSEYQDRFLQLSRYAPEDVNTDAKWKYRFLRGLVDPLQYQLMNHTFPTFQHLIDRYFKPVDDLAAGVPYLIKPNKNLDSLLFENVKIDKIGRAHV